MIISALDVYIDNEKAWSSLFWQSKKIEKYLLEIASEKESLRKRLMKSYEFECWTTRERGTENTLIRQKYLDDLQCISQLVMAGNDNQNAINTLSRRLVSLVEGKGGTNDGLSSAIERYSYNLLGDPWTTTYSRIWELTLSISRADFQFIAEQLRYKVLIKDFAAQIVPVVKERFYELALTNACIDKMLLYWGEDFYLPRIMVEFYYPSSETPIDRIVFRENFELSIGAPSHIAGVPLAGRIGA